MRRIITITYILLLSVLVTAQNREVVTSQKRERSGTVTLNFSGTPLSEALRRIDQSQTDKQIYFFCDELEQFLVNKRIKRKPAFDAVKAVCKGLPVKVEMKGNDICVEAERKAVVLYGHVEDDFLKIGLPKADINVLNAADSTVAVDSVYRINMARSKSDIFSCRFSCEVPPVKRDYLVHASLEGYADAWQRVSVSNPRDGKVEIPVLKMRKVMTRSLQEVTVTATRIKMFWRGDTLVYDATAFKLPDGSMLDDLIRQLPGTELKDNGEIYVNGRKVDELLLGSRSFMRGNRRVLLENLPYYTVKDIKVYEKTSDMSVALGHDVGEKLYVMDVNLKEEYRTGYVANVEAAAGTGKHWLGRGFLLGFRNQWRYTLQANANNVNENHHIGESDNWKPEGMPKDMTTVRSVTAEASYMSKDHNMSNATSVEFRDDDIVTDMRQSRETFLNGLKPHSNSEAATMRDFRFMKVREEFRLLKPFYFNIQGELIRTCTDNHTNTAFRQYTDSLTTTMSTTSLDKSTSFLGFLFATGVGCINKQKKLDLGISIFAQFHGSDTERAQRYDIRQLVSPASSSRTYNVGDVNSHMKMGSADIYIRRPLAKNWHIYSSVGCKHEEKSAHDYLYHPDTLSLPSLLEGVQAFIDPRNSYDSRYTKSRESLNIHLSNRTLSQYMPGLNVLSDRLRINMDISLSQQCLDYRRGAIDTVAHHNMLHLNPELAYSQKFGKGQRNEFKANVKFTTHDLDLIQTIAYRDDSQPLLVNLGNAHLKERQTTTCSLNYANHNGPGKREVSVNSSFNYRHRDIAQSVHYNTATGAYTYQPINIGGSYTCAGDLRYSRYLDSRQRWNVQSTATASLHHSVDHTMFSGAWQSTRNEVNTCTVGESAYIQYNKDALNIRVSGNILWRHSEGRMRDFSTLDALDCQYGVSGRYTIPVIHLTVSADATMYSRRGYGSSTLNTDDFVVNASLSQPFLKGRLIARIEAFDLLHNLSSTQYEVNAQGRTETYYRSLPHYIMAHIVYHWNKNPKKKR